MSKKAKKSSESSEAPDLSLVQKLKAFLLTIQLYVNQLPFVIAFKSRFKIMRARISEKLLQFLLAVFAFFSPCWNFFFLGTPKSNTDNS